MRPGLSFWSKSSQASREATRTVLTQIVEGNIDSLVTTFYSTFLSDPEGAAFLSHSVVHERLSHSLRNWLRDLVKVDPHNDLSAFEARQIKIGEVHARLKIPNSLVMEGASLIKTQIACILTGMTLDTRTVVEALIMLDELIDHSMRLMSAAYLSNTFKQVKNEEAFRLFSLGQDINLERETQRAALMEWSQSVLYGLLDQTSGTRPASLGSSNFGLWVRHRAGVLFQGAPALETVDTLIDRIDEETLPALLRETPTRVAELQQRIEEIKFLLNELFQWASNLESGRDPLTRTLNRRFLPSVMSRELSLAKQTHASVSVLMVDVDHFKALNDAHGHTAGDTALSHVAEQLLGSVRISDFVFRYGGEEFLIVLVESDADRAIEVAERIRQQIAERRITLPNGHEVMLTVSVGVAAHEGHPDYQYMIDAADRALYAAKSGGRNRVELALKQH